MYLLKFFKQICA